MNLENYQKNIDRDLLKEKKKKAKEKKKKEERKIEETVNIELFDEIGPLCLALHRSKLVAMKRVYKTNVTMSRAVLKELKQVSIWNRNILPRV